MGRFAAAPARSRSKSGHGQGHPFSRGYGVIVPSSFTMVLPIALVCSTRPPVSVLVRAPSGCPGAFLGSMDSPASRTRFVVTPRPAATGRVCQPCGLRAFTGTSRTPPGYPPPSPHRSIAPRRRCGNVHPLCIGYACRPRLSSRLTLGGLALPRKPWTCGGGVFHSPPVTHASIRAPGRSTEGRPFRFAPHGTLPYHRIRVSGPPLRCRA